MAAWGRMKRGGMLPIIPREKQKANQKNKMPITGLLRPATNTREAWLFPVMSAPWRHGLGTNARPLHYPKPPMVVPAADLQSVFKDDTLYCVCAALCCDRQTVFVEGNYVFNPDDNETAGAFYDDNDSEMINLIDGGSRDYGLHLELRPLNGRCLLQVQLDEYMTADISEDDGEDIEQQVIDILRSVVILRNARGVIFYDFDFHIKIVIHCASANRDKVKYRIQALLECVANCDGSAFVGCTASVTVEVHNLNEHQPVEFYRWPGGGGGGGGGGWGGGGIGGGGWGGGWGPGTPGWNRDKYEDEDEDEDEATPWLDFGEVDTIIRVIGFSNCRTAVFNRCHCLVDVDAFSLIGVDSKVYAWLNCGGRIHHRCSGNLKNIVAVTGSGQAYTYPAESSHGIMNYKLTALADTRLVTGFVGGNIIELINGSVHSSARAIAGNQPYHEDKHGNRTEGKIGGHSQALSYGIAGKRGGVVRDCDLQCLARAHHPVQYAALARVYQIIDAITSGNQGSQNYCDSNVPGWCDRDKE